MSMEQFSPLCPSTGPEQFARNYHLVTLCNFV
jgi:hypothetical protein